MSIGTKAGAPAEPCASARLSIAWRDAELAPDIVAPGPPPAEVREILVTGGTGFFGRHLLDELLRSTDAHLHVLVRGDGDAAARARLSSSLARVGQDLEALRGRVTVHRGDGAEERFGLAGLAYEGLAERVDLVFHGAAEVNWARSYRGLRETNVGGTLQAIRFAARRRTKRMAFISTIAAGFMDGGPAHVDESTPTLPHLDRMPLGYAQTKCVSEDLLRQAADRGIPAVVTRASLLIGDTRSGEAADADLTTALIEGCVRKARALDIDWLFECLPVDYAARASLALSLAGQGGFERYHLRARNPRHWREIALWLNLMGYGVELEPVPDWLERQFGSRSAKVARLFPFRRFFIGLPGTPPALRPFEIFLRAQRKVDCSLSEGRLASLGVHEPLLDLAYFERCVDDLRRRDVLPDATGGARPGRTRSCPPEASRACGGGGVATVERLPFDASAGFLNEIAAARYGGALGVRLERWTTERGGGTRERQDVLVKSRPSDEDMHRLLADVAGFCDPALGEAVRRFPHLLRRSRAGITEAALHAVLPAGVRALLPAFRGSWSAPGGAVQSHAESFVRGQAWTAADGPWSAGRLEGIARAFARIHAVAGRDESAVRAALPRQLGAQDAMDAGPFWRELAGFTARVLDGPGHVGLAALLDDALGTLGSWWPDLDRQPTTLVHNDANPRNVIWVEETGGERPVLVDWELAGLGLPQADMAELACFVLPDEAGPPAFTRLMEDHRLLLERATGRGWDREDWHRGARHALLRFGLSRLPLYAMAHRIRPQVWILGAARRWAAFASARQPR
jgi:thioester reductase-like protein